MWEAWLTQPTVFFPDGHPCSYEPRPIGLNFSEQWEAGFSLLSSHTANNSLSFLGDVKVVKGKLTHIKKFKLECPMEIFKKGMSGVEIILAWLSRVESQARDSQCWLELLYDSETITPWKDQQNLAPGEKPMIFDADMNKKFKNTFCISLFHCNLITDWANSYLPESWWLQEAILFV